MAAAAHAFVEQPALAPLRGQVQVECVSGLEHVLARLADLEELVAGTPQQFELQDIPYFLDRPQRLRTKPHLLLIYSGARRTLAGGVLLLEFRRCFFSPDRAGRGSVFAPQHLRVDLAAVATRYFLDRSARFINIDLELGTHAAPEGDVEAVALTGHRLGASTSRDFDWALDSGVAPPFLALYPNFDVTLAPLSRKARKNLRRYQRLAIHQLGCTFDPDAHLTRDEFLELAAESHYAVDGRSVRWRHRSIQRFANTFLCGLQAPSGRWLSIAGCRRNGTTVELDWQMNRKGFEAFSLVTALRSSLMQHEGRRGTQQLMVEGGNLHQVSDESARNALYNLAARRPASLLFRCLSFVLPRALPLHFVTTALARPGRVWLPAATPPRKPPLREVSARRS